MTGPRTVLFAGAALLVGMACLPASGQPRDDDPHIVEDGRGIQDSRGGFVSPPSLGRPIYGCGARVTVKDFFDDADIEIYVDSDGLPDFGAVPVRTVPGSGGDPVTGYPVTIGTLTPGQWVYARQVSGGSRSEPSNIVPVTSHLQDYPDGLPQPRLFKAPLLSCGRAVLVEDVVPNSSVEITAENPRPGGGFDPPATVGGFEATTEWGANWTEVAPRFALDARITATARLCSSISPPSEAETVRPAPSPMPPGMIDPSFVSGQSILTIWGEHGPAANDFPQHGAFIRIFQGSAPVGQSPVPGGAPSRVRISPAVPTPPPTDYTVTQELCEESRPSTPQAALPCSELPPAKIKALNPGDDTIHVVNPLPNTKVLVVSNLPLPLGGTIGNNGGANVKLSRKLILGEEIRVLRVSSGGCRSRYVYVITVECTLGRASGACSGEWPAFRQSGLRTAQQVQYSPLADPYKVKRLASTWQPFTPPDGGRFTASPVVHNGIVFIGTTAGHLYAIDPARADNPLTPQDERIKWQYPPLEEKALLSYFGARGACANDSSAGIAASVSIASVQQRAAVILGAPDPGRPTDPGGFFGAGLGSGRLFALDAETGSVLWMTREQVAVLNGNSSSLGELHEQIGYSSPLVLGDRIYVGIADHCDNPIQNGRAVAVDLNTGSIIPAFKYFSTSTRGGGIWNALAGGLGDGVFATTGNTKSGNPAGEPALNNGLSMIRLDPATGALQGKLQPVPFDLDEDPDWAAGVTLANASCGPLALSTMKDGWSYAGSLGPPLAFRWQFPDTAYPFPSGGPLVHGDIRYHRPGATWNDSFIAMMGGEDAVTRDSRRDSYVGYRRLHALNVCAGPAERVRWIAELQGAPGPGELLYTAPPPEQPMPVPGEPPADFETRLKQWEREIMHYWALGPPTVTHGIVYVGTNNGYLLAIADPSIWPAQGSTCTRSDMVNNAVCAASGVRLVPKPTILKSINLGWGPLTRAEPVLANGRIYVAAPGPPGKLFILEPK
jgi:outer membrane protein assembly factor BamB